MLACPICRKQYPTGSTERCADDGSLLYELEEAVVDAPQEPLAIGGVVAGKYELLEEIGRRSGAGRTFRARQIHLERVVELRVLPNNTLTRPAEFARFHREVATWGRMRSDYVVRLYDSGFTDQNAPYMALEATSGGSVGARLREAGPLPFEICWQVAADALSGLQAAHQARVLHRDLSPDSIVMVERPDGTVFFRLTGFGLAKHLGDGDGDDDPTAITMTGQVIGNPAYMAPETILQGLLEPRTDLYALGVTLYELARGVRPFAGTSLADVLSDHIGGQAEPLASHRADLPPAFCRFVERLMAREPSERFASAEQGLQALERVGEDSFRAVDGPEVGSSVPRSTGSWMWIVLAGGGLIAGAATVGWWLLR